MGDEVELPTCSGWNCNERIRFLQDSCRSCGTQQDWYQFYQIQCPNCNQAVDSTQRSCYCGAKLSVWLAILQEALTYPAHTDLTVAKGAVPHPSNWEFEEGGGKPVGQESNYRLALPDERGIHVKEYEDHYKVHWDKVAPSQNGIGHLLSDAPVETALALGVLYLLHNNG